MAGAMSHVGQHQSMRDRDTLDQNSHDGVIRHRHVMNAEVEGLIGTPYWNSNVILGRSKLGELGSNGIKKSPVSGPPINTSSIYDCCVLEDFGSVSIPEGLVRGEPT